MGFDVRCGLEDSKCAERANLLNEFSTRNQELTTKEHKGAQRKTNSKISIVSNLVNHAL